MRTSGERGCAVTRARMRGRVTSGASRVHACMHARGRTRGTFGGRAGSRGDGSRTFRAVTDAARARARARAR
ncbi:hypothetical protein CRG98_044212 [Punica granatum]|uniref:Uncharacterized protein n=1 Tax=Punica granatum TaxID=22663 RepID=A0A2I0HUM0_PUNGR|nr:hypothetical protein CRG98_044212 [Punica granatum]